MPRELIARRAGTRVIRRLRPACVDSPVSCCDAGALEFDTTTDAPRLAGGNDRLRSRLLIEQRETRPPCSGEAGRRAQGRVRRIAVDEIPAPASARASSNGRHARCRRRGCRNAAATRSSVLGIADARRDVASGRHVEPAAPVQPEQSVESGAVQENQHRGELGRVGGATCAGPPADSAGRARVEAAVAHLVVAARRRRAGVPAPAPPAQRSRRRSGPAPSGSSRSRSGFTSERRTGTPAAGRGRTGRKRPRRCRTNGSKYRSKLGRIVLGQRGEQLTLAASPLQQGSHSTRRRCAHRHALLYRTLGDARSVRPYVDLGVIRGKAATTSSAIQRPDEGAPPLLVGFACDRCVAEDQLAPIASEGHLATLAFPPPPPGKCSAGDPRNHSVSCSGHGSSPGPAPHALAMAVTVAISRPQMVRGCEGARVRGCRVRGCDGARVPAYRER